MRSQWWQRVVAGPESSRQVVLARLVGDRPEAEPDDLGGVEVRSVVDADGGLVVWMSASTRRGPRTSVDVLVEWGYQLNLSVPRLRIVVPDLEGFYAGCGEQAVADFAWRLGNFGVEFIFGVGGGGTVYPIRGSVFQYPCLLTFAETGQEVSPRELLRHTDTPEAAAFIRQYRARIPSQPPLDESWRPSEAQTGSSATEESRPRYVNLILTDRDPDEPITGPLEPGSFHWLWCNIGDRVRHSLITEDRPFPVEHLPPTSAGWWLTVVLDDGDGIDETDVYEMFLPLDGPSFVCTCTPGGLHHCRDRRWEYRQMFFRAQDVPGTMSLRVMIYLESALVQAIELALPVGVEGTASGRITWSRTEAITELDLVAKRSVSAFSDERDGRHRFVFGAGRGTYAAFELGEAQAGSLARGLRAGLYRAHFDVTGKHLVSRYDDSLSLDRDRYLADLRALAVEGAKAYQALVMDSDTRDRMRAWLAAEATVLGRPPIIQLARATNTRLCFPWQLVYDEPVFGDGSTLAICPSVWDFGPGGQAGEEIPARCPHEADHGYGDGTLCPFGFWGFAHVLEVPPWTSSAAVPTRTGQGPPASLAVAFHAGLAGAAWDRHRATLATLSDNVQVSTDTRTLRSAVGEGVDVLYFLCHGIRTAGTGTAPPGMALDLGDGGTLTPTDVAAWSRLRPPLRWRLRKPLVILNGCHTGEILPDTVTDFVSAFVADVGAAGLLATEITLELSLATAAMESFLAGLWSGKSTGEALRAMRWKLLSRGNVMGLSYSPYCDAELSLPTDGGHQ